MAERILQPGRPPALYRHWILLSAATLLVFCLLLEGVTRLGFARISHIESRIAVEHKAALQVGPTPGKVKILLLGNSLPLEAIVIDQLNRSFEGRAEVVRFVIEATEYLDWYYGIKRLFAQGSSPDVVLLCIDATHLGSMATRGDYSSFYLFQARDIAAIGKTASYDLTKTAGLLLARYSLFYAGRTNLRNFVLNHVDDSYAAMIRDLPKSSAATGAAKPQTKNVQALYATRLRALQELCAERGKRFVLLIPPGFGHSEAMVLQAARQSTTDVLIPVHENEYAKDQYRDGYHLTPKAAVQFTNRLRIDLHQYLERDASH